MQLKDIRTVVDTWADINTDLGKTYTWVQVRSSFSLLVQNLHVDTDEIVSVSFGGELAGGYSLGVKQNLLVQVRLFDSVSSENLHLDTGEG